MTKQQSIQINDFNFDNFDLLDYIDDSIVESTPIINSIVVDINNWGKYDTYLFNYYGNDGMRYLKLVLAFNNISDITEIKLGQIIKFPDVVTLCQNLYETTIFDSNIPGINTFESQSIPVEIKNKQTSNRKVAQPKLNISMKKSSYDPVTGNIKF